MRFKDLSPEAVECLWDRWKYSVERVLYEFNEDVFGGRGRIQENSYGERLYLCLESQKRFVYIFPIEGNVLVMGIFRNKIEKEYLRSKSPSVKFDRENIIAWAALETSRVEEEYGTNCSQRLSLETMLKLLYRNHWSTIAF